MPKEPSPKTLLSRFPFLAILTQKSNFMMVLLNQKGKVLYCHHLRDHYYHSFSSALFNQLIFDFFSFPKGASIQEAIKDYPAANQPLSNLNWDSAMLLHEGGQFAGFRSNYG